MDNYVVLILRQYGLKYSYFKEYKDALEYFKKELPEAICVAKVIDRNTGDWNYE